MITRRSRRGQAGPVAGLLALSVLLGLLASLAARKGSTAPATADSGPYIERFDGQLQQHAHAEPAGFRGASGGGELAGAGEVAVNRGAVANSSAGHAPRGVPGRPAPAGDRLRLSAAVRTETGRELSSLLANADVSVLAVGHQGGSYAFSRTDGWLKLDGTTWVVVPYSALPPDLKAAYPPEVYGTGSARLQTAVHLGKGGVSREGDASRDPAAVDEPFDPKRAPVTYEPTLDLDAEPKKGKKKEQIP